ncbi:hypothetical protein BJX68DRAFT_260669 [Aspergillus pseudodeflectus]|uniref:Arf-GAP domain-containing protein n=1 Tax=Aspergillus pseudodeflectus TaxID=176178 RepID=A0ABR4LEG6_9EURO
MVIGISKRQQQRNERALQDLIRSVPGNDRCADCSAMNPGWASWNLGVFLCMRCAALHRKMGTHISKVKSLSMDSWSSEQVDEMKSHGNTIVNKIYNPRNVQPPVPTDIDESDACMERFIRQKYQTRTLEDGRPKPPSRQDPSYTTRSPEGSPPPLPPKPSRPFGFGLRSASSATNLSRQSASSRGPESPVSDSRRSSFETKLTRLREMGFTNERRNLTALKSLDGNLDKTIETLVRVGEGRQTPQVKTPAATTSGASVNPFDQLDFKPPAQPAQPNGLSFNPFDIPTQQAQLQPQPAPAQSLEQSFQNLQVTQPLFPHSTGGYPNRQTAQPQYIYGQPAAPSAAPQAGFVSSPQPLEGGNNPFFQTGAQPQASLSTPQPQNPYPAQNNPFFNQMSTQAPQMPLQNQSSASAFPQPPRHANTMPPMSTSPFGQPPPFQQPQQQPQHVQQQQLQQPQLGVQTAQPGNSFNPFQSMTAPNTPLAGGYPSQTPFGYPAAAQTLAPQPTGRVDKNSILALYNFSAPPPAIPEQQQTQQQAVPGLGAPPGQLQNPQAAFASSNYTNASPQPNVNAQAATSRNPFGYPGASGAQQPPAQVPTQANPYGLAMNSANAGANTAFMKSHMSQQSVDINGFQSGRHSPDAFASLSSRFGR